MSIHRLIYFAFPDIIIVLKNQYHAARKDPVNVMAYKGYNESRKNSTLKYMKDKMKIINLRIPKDKYAKEVEPYIERSGLKMATFIKKAIQEKIYRDYGVSVCLTDTDNGSAHSGDSENTEA